MPIRRFLISDRQPFHIDRVDFHFLSDALLDQLKLRGKIIGPEPLMIALVPTADGTVKLYRPHHGYGIETWEEAHQAMRENAVAWLKCAHEQVREANETVQAAELLLARVEAMSEDQDPP